MQVGLRQRLINTCLVGTKRATALQQQRDLFERRALMRHGRPPVTAVLRRNKPTVLAPLLASGRQRIRRYQSARVFRSARKKACPLYPRKQTFFLLSGDELQPLV